MKNIVKYFIISPVLILIFIALWANVDLIALGTKVIFGTAYWKDSLSNGVVTNKSIYLQSGDSLYYNGHTVTSGTGGGGGGDVTQSGNNAFTGRNTSADKFTFNDTALFNNRIVAEDKVIMNDTALLNGLSIIDNARITTGLAVTGDVTTDLNFLKGSSTSIGSISTDSIAITTNGTKRIIIRPTGQMDFLKRSLFSDTLKVSGALAIVDSINVLKNTLLTDGFGLTWYLGGSSVSTIKSISTAMTYNSSSHNFNTPYGTYVFYADSSTGFSVKRKFNGSADTILTTSKIISDDNITAGSFTGAGSGITTINASNISSGTLDKARYDTADVFRKGASITQTINALVTFAQACIFSGTATFNGIVTLTSDLVVSWVKNQSSVTPYQYEKTKIVAMKLGASTASTTSVAHGITDWHTIKGFTACIMDDSSNTMILPNNYSDNASSVGKLFQICFVDSLNINIRIPSGGVNLVSDSAFFRITYTDFNR